MKKSISSRILWLAKGAALFWGSALTLALIMGVATTALAAVPGDHFKLGRIKAPRKVVATDGAGHGAPPTERSTKEMMKREVKTCP